jgi:uncharacterized protein YbjT (DUF2867 family)
MVMRLSLIVTYLFFSLLVESCSALVSSSASRKTVLVIGDTGFLGSEIVSQLEQLDIDYKTASKSAGVDITAPDAAQQIQGLAKGCDAVISTVGSIGNKEDERINAASGQAAIGAKQAGVQRFVVIGNDPQVREFSKSCPPLQNYASGKEKAEQIIKDNFPDSYTIIRPTFMYGGDDFSLSPPRIPDSIGGAAENILGLYPFQAASEALPGVIGMLMAAPVSRERVAKAAINAAMGLCQGEFDSRDDIILAASKRLPKLAPTRSNSQNAEMLKQQIYDLGDCQGDPDTLEEAFGIFEQIESLQVRKPATDPLLNGRWDFVFDVEADMGTGVVKDIINGDSPVKLLLNLEDLYMTIETQSRINIMVSTKVLGIPMELKLQTSFKPDSHDPTGTLFLEKFEGIELMGIALPVPDQWQRSRPLEFTYLDETMLIARGNGGEPHYLRRELAI